MRSRRAPSRRINSDRSSEDVADAVRRVAGPQAIEQLSHDFAEIAQLCRNEREPARVAERSHALWHADQQLRVLHRRVCLSKDPVVAAAPIDGVLQVLSGLLNADAARTAHAVMLDRHQSS